MFSQNVPFALILSIIVVLVISSSAIVVARRYKTCPSNKILVKYGRVGHGKHAVPIHGGATFVVPLIQSYAYMDLTPIALDINLRGALSKENIRLDVPSQFTVAISTEPEGMMSAAERLLGLSGSEIRGLAENLIFGQLRATIAAMRIEEINADREAFEKHVMDNIETELKKVGLKLINVNITDIKDQSGYLEALGKQAAAQATNTALVQVAQEERSGAVGQAQAKQEQRIQVANANAAAVKGENEAAAQVADSEAQLRVRRAEAARLGQVAEATTAARAQEEAYQAETLAEQARATMEQARQTANVVVPARIAREQAVIEAEANKERERLAGEARGVAAKAEEEGRAAGMFARLEQQAKGFRELVQAAGSAESAVMLMVADKLPEIAAIQAQAIANIKFDKVIVMDGGQGGDASGTARFLSSLVGALPPLHEFVQSAGIKLPEFLGELTSTVDAAVVRKGADATSAASGVTVPASSSAAAGSAAEAAT